MKIDLPDTSTQTLVKRLRALREERGEIATGRVLTFIVVLYGEDDIAQILDTLYESAREHPARVLVLVLHRGSEESRLDGEIRMGGDAGASEVILMHLHGELAAHRASVVTPFLLPDTPIVAWWPTRAPRNPATDPIGELAQRRITDACTGGNIDDFYRRRLTYSPGDSDLAWSRITLWRGVLASMVDQLPQERINSVDIYGSAEDPTVDIAAGWLVDRLDIPVTRHASEPKSDWEGLGIERTVLHCASGSAVVEIVDAFTASMSVQGKSSLVTLAHRPLSDCLAEELRHLDPDETYGRALRRLVRVTRPHHGQRAEGATQTLEDLESEASRR